MYSSESQTSLSQQPLFEVSLFAFHIASALQYYTIVMVNIQ